MKLIIIAAFLSSIFFAISAQAHGGGLNSEGCHTNRKTGDYHCHRAPAAKPQQRPVDPSSATGNPNLFWLRFALITLIYNH